jgi:ribosomal protein S12 methylthiotransferase accessory factor
MLSRSHRLAIHSLRCVEDDLSGDAIIRLSGHELWSRGLIDKRFGPILETSLLRLGIPEPNWWVCRASLARTPPGTRFTSARLAAAGTSIDLEEAELRGMGEALERYSALTVDFVGRPLIASAMDRSLQFPRCAVDEQCPDSFRSIPADAQLTFVEVRRLSDDATTLVPAGYVHLHFRPDSCEPMVTLSISTGVAFRPSLVDAIWCGLCEVAERDALMLMWWLQLSVAEIVVKTVEIPPALAVRLAALERANLSARFFDMSTNFHVPTVFCLLVGTTYPHLSVGAACRCGAVEAICKSLDEAVAGRIVLREIPRKVQDSSRTPQTLENHLLYYADGRNATAFKFLTESKTAVGLKEFIGSDWWAAPKTMADLAARASHLLAEGLTALWADITVPEIAALGYVVKVTVPEMVPLSPDHSCRWLATPRLMSRGKVKDATTGAFNPNPHPFG